MTVKITITLIVFCMFVRLTAGNAARYDLQVGEALFEKNCAPCHPNGGNILNKNKTLSKKDLAQSNILTSDDIIRKIRNPGAFDFHPSKFTGMKIFDEKALPEDDARRIAEYILNTF